MAPCAASVAALLRAVARPSLAALAHARGVQRPADDLVSDPGEVADAAGPDQDDRVLLQVMTLAGDVGGDLDPRGQADAGDLAQGGVRLLRGHRVDARADSPPLG